MTPVWHHLDQHAGKADPRRRQLWNCRLMLQQRLLRIKVADNTEYAGELPDIEILEMADDMSGGDGMAE